MVEVATPEALQVPRMAEGLVQSIVRQRDVRVDDMMRLERRQGGDFGETSKVHEWTRSWSAWRSNGLPVGLKAKRVPRPPHRLARASFAENVAKTGDPLGSTSAEVVPAMLPKRIG